jgi:hypothetical protein
LSRRATACAEGRRRRFLLHFVHSGLLGALITLSPGALYDAAELWGLSAIEDQQLAGLLMWVPMGAVYSATCLRARRGLPMKEAVTD